MLDSAPEGYKQLAQHCCDVDPDNCPDALALEYYVYNLVKEVENDNFVEYYLS